MLRLKETPEDLAVKVNLWISTEKEALFFGRRFADEHVVGTAYSDGQKSVAAAAKKKGYPVGLIRSLARGIRKDAPEKVTECLSDYRQKIGLN